MPVFFPRLPQDFHSVLVKSIGAVVHIALCSTHFIDELNSIGSKFLTLCGRLLMLFLALVLVLIVSRVILDESIARGCVLFLVHGWHVDGLRVDVI